MDDTSPIKPNYDIHESPTETKKTTFNMHNLFVVLTVMLIAALVVVLGINYFVGFSNLQGHSFQYLCHGNLDQMVKVCFKS